MQFPRHVCPHALSAFRIGISVLHTMCEHPRFAIIIIEGFAIFDGRAGIRVDHQKEIFIRLLEIQDTEALLALECGNREFFQLYTVTREESFYTKEGQTERIRKAIKAAEEGTSCTFGIFLTSSEKLIGIVSLSEIARGDFQSCWIGYYLDRAYNGRGYMTEAVTYAVGFAFKELGLHRIEAGVMPHNKASIRLLEKAGFEKEGIARENVRINGKWEDHQILSLINRQP